MTEADRTKLHELLELLVEHRAQLDYPHDDVRGPLDVATFHLTKAEAVRRLHQGGRLMFDCSGSLTCAFKWEHLHDPNGLGYRHLGYTGTMLANPHLEHYRDASRARVGALVVFGPGTGEHVAAVLKPGEDPWLFSHGLRGVTGPIRLSEERKFHHPPVTFLSVVAL